MKLKVNDFLKFVKNVGDLVGNMVILLWIKQIHKKSTQLMDILSLNTKVLQIMGVQNNGKKESQGKK